MNLADLGIEIRASGSVEQRVPCPCCSRGKGDDALGVNVETGVFHCFRCGWKGCAASESGAPGRALVQRLDGPAVVARKRERLRATWRQTVPLDDSGAYSVRRYLEARALGEVLRHPPSVLRAHPGLMYWDGTREIGTFPAMVALFHGSAGEPVTLHVTYISGIGKAPVPSPKKILGVPTRGATRGGAIHLHEPRAGILGIAEGIESALSLYLLQQVPVWASFCADNLARAHLPAGLRRLLIGVDLDESGKGQQVAAKLAARVQEWSPRTRVLYVKPEVDGFGDLNDELRRRAS